MFLCPSLPFDIPRLLPFPIPCVLPSPFYPSPVLASVQLPYLPAYLPPSLPPSFPPPSLPPPSLLTPFLACLPASRSPANPPQILSTAPGSHHSPLILMNEKKGERRHMQHSLTCQLHLHLFSPQIIARAASQISLTRKSAPWQW